MTFANETDNDKCYWLHWELGWDNNSNVQKKSELKLLTERRKKQKFQLFKDGWSRDSHLIVTCKHFHWLHDDHMVWRQIFMQTLSMVTWWSRGMSTYRHSGPDLQSSQRHTLSLPNLAEGCSKISTSLIS